MSAGHRWCDPSVLKLELERVFRRSWLFACPALRVSEPGAFAVFDLANESVIIWRDADGRLRGFVNACPHRGARLLDGAGQAERLTCSYHCFAYAQDGRLLAAPHLDSPPSLELEPIPVEERFGLVWLNFGATETLAQHLQPLASELGSRQLDQFGLDSEVSVQLDCNWKLSADVHAEALHVPSLHSEIASAVDHRGAKVTRLAPHARIDVEPRREGLGKNVLLYVFPNLHLNLHDDYALVFRHRPDASEPMRCTFDQLALSRGAAGSVPSPRQVAFDDPTIGPVTAADLEIAESMQRGLATGRIEPQNTHPERVLTWMLEELDQRLTRA